MALPVLSIPAQAALSHLLLIPQFSPRHPVERYFREGMRLGRAVPSLTLIFLTESLWRFYEQLMPVAYDESKGTDCGKGVQR